MAPVSLEIRLFHALDHHPYKDELLKRPKVETVGIATSEPPGEYFVLVRTYSLNATRGIKKELVLQTTDGLVTLRVVTRKIVKRKMLRTMPPNRHA